MIRKEISEMIQQYEIRGFLGINNKTDILDAFEAIFKVRDSGKVNMSNMNAVRDELYNIGEDWLAESFNSKYYEQYMAFIFGNYSEI